MKIVLAGVLCVLTVRVADAQTPAEPGTPIAQTTASGPLSSPPPSAGQRRWHGQLSLANSFDGNINHDPVPLRSFGLSPAAAVGYETAAFAFRYDLALNSYTGTDDWDRVSQGLFVAVTRRAGRVRLETAGSATWKGSSEDRELANEFALTERVIVRASNTVRLVLTGAYRYKQYPDDADTSGASPFIGGKIDRRVGDGHLIAGYKYQTRRSRAVRDRYHRQMFSIGYAMPVDLPGDELAFELEYRPQRYERLITVGDRRVPRQDQRFTLTASYARPISARVHLVWLAGLENRRSNDRDKEYRAPSLAMTLTYQWP